MIGTLFLLDSNKKLVYVASNEDEVVFYDYEYHSYLETGADTLDFKLKLEKNARDKVKTKGFALFFRGNTARMFQIMEIKEEENILDVTLSVKSETVALELYNSQIRPCMMECNPKSFFEVLLQDTNYKLGYVSPALENNIKTIEIKETTDIYVMIQEAIKIYENIEIDFRAEVIDPIKGKYEFYIDVYADGEKGNKTYKRIESDFNSYGIVRKQNVSEFCSGIIPIGNNDIDIKDVEWVKEKGFPLDKPQGQDFLLDPEAHNMFSNGDKYIIKAMTFDADTTIDLCYLAYQKLQEIKNVKFDYEIPVYLTDEEYQNINTGDTVHIVSDKFDPPIQLEARISELILTDNENKCVFSNYKEVKSNIKDWTKNDILDQISDALVNGGKLTQADIDYIKQFMKDLEIKSEEIDNKLNELEENLEDKITEPAEDEEDYSVVNLDNVDNGLWIGDNNLYEIKKAGCNKTTGIVGTKGTVYGVNVALNIRSGGSISHEIVGSMPKGAECEVLGAASTGWYQVRYNGIEGYASNKYILLEDSEGTVDSSVDAKEYQKAKEYYAKFNLGTLGNSSSMEKLRSSNNSYKISTIVKYWAKKFGLDPQLVFAMIMAESSGNPYCATKTSAGGYGLMQCERSAYFGIKQTVKFLDGSTKSFTPSYSTMTPKKGGNTTLNGVTVDKNISNQVMFGCHEFRKSLERFHYNIFASLCGYNFGLYGCDLCICKYVAEKNGLSWKNQYGYTCQSKKVQELYFKELDTLQCAWSNERKWYKTNKGGGTPNNIELYLRWYKIENGQLPYTLDKNGKKRGYGCNKTSTTTTNTNTTVQTGVATSVRNKIVAKAREIVDLHVKYKKATYDQGNRIVDDSKRFKAKGTIRGIKNPYCYDCSSLVSCAYKCVGLTSVYAKSCQAGTLVQSATSKSGYKMFKLTKSSIENAIAGDIIMFCNNKCPSSLTRSQAMSYKFTHHTAIYCGKVNGKHMLAHASKWAYHPNAIRYESFDAYNNQYKTKDYHLWNYCFILRPWDLAKLDKEATETITSTETPEIETTEVTTYELNIKALPNLLAEYLYYEGKLIEDITINDIEDDTKFPATVSHVYLDLTDINTDNYINLINILLGKYKKTPIFVAKTNNTDIDLALTDYANITPYVIMLDDPTTSDVTSSNAKSSYSNIKKAILAKVKKEEPVKEEEKIQPIKINLTLKEGKLHEYLKTPANDITFLLPSKLVETYWSKLTFITATENIKFKQSNIVYMDGDDCVKGQLKPNPNTKYYIVCYANPDRSGDITTKYIGSVTAVPVGGTYEKQSRKKFKGADDVVTLATSFYDKREKFQYNTTTPCSFSNPQENISKWKVDGLYNCDCSTLAKLVYMGHKYQTSPYAKATTKLARNSKYSWAFTLPRTAAGQAKYCVEKGWILSDITSVNIEEAPKGSLIFYDRDNGDNDRYLNISHVAICIGDGYTIEATTVTGAFRKKKIIENSSDKVILVAYPAKY